jgi:hypothetical protein
MARSKRSGLGNQTKCGEDLSREFKHAPQNKTEEEVLTKGLGLIHQISK